MPRGLACEIHGSGERFKPDLTHQSHADVVFVPTLAIDAVPANSKRLVPVECLRQRSDDSMREVVNVAVKAGVSAERYIEGDVAYEAGSGPEAVADARRELARY